MIPEHESVPDLRDQPVKAGDLIAYAVTTGRSANVRIGRVVEIVWEHNRFDSSWDREHNYPTKVPTKLRVQVEQSAFGGLYTDKPTLIEAGFKRFVKLEELPPAPPVPKTSEEIAAFAKDWDRKVEEGRKS